MKNITVFSLVLWSSLTWAAKLLPYGYLELDSPRIPEKLRPEILKASRSVGWLETRAKKDIHDREKTETVVVKAGELIGSGTAYIGAPGNIVYTANHVIRLWSDNRETLELHLYINGKHFLLDRVLSVKDENDFASLGLGEKLPDALDISENKKVEEGSHVFYLGYPLGSHKLKVVLGNVLKSERNLFFLSSPSLHGMSGSPILSFTGENHTNGVIGTLHGMEGISEIPGLKGAISVDYEVFEDRNLRMFRLIAVNDPEKTLEISKDAAGSKFQSKIIDDYLHPRGLLAMGLWNYHVWRRADVIKDFRDKIDKDINRLEMNRTKSDMEEVNEKLKFLGYSSLHFPSVLVNLPLHTDDELKTLTADDFILELKATKEEVTERAQVERQKAEFLESTDAIVSYLLQLKKKPNLLDGADHLNRAYIYTPALCTAIP